MVLHGDMIHGFTIFQLGVTGNMDPDPGPNYNLIRKQAGRQLTPDPNRGDPNPQIQTGETPLLDPQTTPQTCLAIMVTNCGSIAMMMKN